MTTISLGALSPNEAMEFASLGQQLRNLAKTRTESATPAVRTAAKEWDKILYQVIKQARSKKHRNGATR